LLLNSLVWDPTITLGVVIHLVVLIATIVWTFAKLRSEIRDEIAVIRTDIASRFAVLESKVGDLWDTWKRNGSP